MLIHKTVDCDHVYLMMVKNALYFTYDNTTYRLGNFCTSGIHIVNKGGLTGLAAYLHSKPK